MQPIEIIEGKVSVLDRSDVDTDQIIPKQFLKRVERTGFGEFLFYDWFRSGEISLEPNPILVTGRNFGCGSSREHAPWALEDFGFRVIIAPSFADIFYNNCFKNGLLPIVLSDAIVDQLFTEMYATEGYQLTIDLAGQVGKTPSGESFAFEVDEFRKHCLLNGLDDIGLTLEHADAIRNYEAKRREQAPWLFDAVK